jgi:hypothetical protein
VVHGLGALKLVSRYRSGWLVRLVEKDAEMGNLRGEGVNMGELMAMEIVCVVWGDEPRELWRLSSQLVSRTARKHHPPALAGIQLLVLRGEP